MRGGKRERSGAPFKFYANKDDMIIVELNGKSYIYVSCGTEERGNVMRLLAPDGQTITLRRPRPQEIKITM